MSARPTDEEVDEQLNAASEADENGSRWPGMTYEQGVDAALRWAMGWTDDRPMEDA